MNKSKKIISTNKKAFHDFNILERYTAGMVLFGTEIKSIRSGRINLKDSYAQVDNGEIWVHKMHISPYEQGNRYNRDPERVRKLLLTKQEIRKLIGTTKESGITIVPLELYLENGWAKLEIGVAKAKKLHDKRETLIKKTTDREIERAIKQRY
ncbi:MAG: SsrA-binding protein SmpB [Candidatus Gastranaerophilales bacterium]|nr:SsrA-binding protein SmpB [Candidatus Gastranaerophilales bacterium]